MQLASGRTLPIVIVPQQRSLPKLLNNTARLVGEGRGGKAKDESCSHWQACPATPRHCRATFETNHHRIHGTRSTPHLGRFADASRTQTARNMIWDSFGSLLPFFFF